MKKNLILIFWIFIVFANKSVSQNIIYLGVEESNTETAFDLPISLDNTDEIVAIQFDINFNDAAFELLTGHQLTSRASSHALGVSSPSPGVIRIIIYSNNNASISGSTGELLTIKLKSKTLPGVFILNYSDVVVSSTTGSPLTTSVQEGSVTVLGPHMNILASEIDFGRVPIGSNPTTSIRIDNIGNLPLELTDVNSILPFSIQESFPITINANSSTNLTLLIDSTVKFNSSIEMNFQNNDPDPIRNLKSVLLKAEVFAVNEIIVGSGSGEINTAIEIPVTIDNMEPFTGFQFDIILPSGIDYVFDSIIESNRFDGHSISANIINGTTLRFIAYSLTNKNFIGTDGEVFSFKLIPNIESGTYPLTITNAILSNLTLGDIVSDIYDGSVQINSPNLSLNPTAIFYGNVPITETRETTIRLTNSGSAMLTIDDVVYPTEELSLDIQLPLDIPIGEFQDVNLIFTPINTGEFSESISFRHNGPDEQNLLNIQASKFSPNFVMVESQQGYVDETNIFEISLKNNDPVRAVQFDVELPTGFSLNVNDVETTDRTEGFSVAASYLSDTTYRVILYAKSNLLINPGDLSIITFPVFIEDSVAPGVYLFNFENIIISNETNLDISSESLENGEITILSLAELKLNTFLQGSYDPSTNLMKDDLRSNGLIPTTSPYPDNLIANTSVFNQGGDSGQGLIENDIVDWVWVELRDENDYTTIIESKSALLQRDGDLVDTDGTSNIIFNSFEGNYYVLVNHRNHLGILSAIPIEFSGVTTLNFSSNQNTILGGVNALADLGSGVYGMFSGDFDSNGQIQNSDTSGVVLLLGSSGYSAADMDMNGQVQNTDINNIIIPNTGNGEQF